MKIICVVGTRPEVIKMVPLIKKISDCHEVITVTTGQHREMLYQTAKSLDLTFDIDLNLMKDNQTVVDVLSDSTKLLSKIISDHKPDVILSQGDTMTVLAAAQASYYNKIPFGHVEAGLRTWNYDNPWPEEMNRTLISKLSYFHFCPTEGAKLNLLNEGITQNVYVTGNTVIDTLKSVVVPKQNKKDKIILVTVHRRENFGEPLNNIINSLLSLVDRNNDITIIFPVHPNPNIRKIVFERLKHPRIKLIEPTDYITFCNLMNDSFLIITDSGGIQEEAPSLGVPVFVLRDYTERPESIDCGTSKLIGTNQKSIVDNVENLLSDGLLYNKMSSMKSPYGDGKSSTKILNILNDYEREIH